MKRKLLSFGLVLVLCATTIIGGTLAYFTDTDEKDNVFTTGRLTIALEETFEQNAKLVPATGSLQDGTLRNAVTKEIAVTNQPDSEKSYVRVHIAIPSILGPDNPTQGADNGILHFCYDTQAVGEGKWDWSKTSGVPYEGDWNTYETTIDGISYRVYVVTYDRVLMAGETTAEKAIRQVYLDSEVTGEDIADINSLIGENWEIKVIAEGTQAEGFDDAYTALNTAFGIPGNYDAFHQ